MNPYGYAQAPQQIPIQHPSQYAPQGMGQPFLARQSQSVVPMTSVKSGEIEPFLRGFTFVRIEKSDGWERAARTELHYSQTDLATIVKPSVDKKGKSKAMAELQSMSSHKQGQVNRLLQSLKAEENPPGTEWNLVHIKADKKTNSKQKTETTMIEVVVQLASVKQPSKKSDKSKDDNPVKVDKLVVPAKKAAKKSASNIPAGAVLVDLNEPGARGREPRASAPLSQYQVLPANSAPYSPPPLVPAFNPLHITPWTPPLESARPQPTYTMPAPPPPPPPPANPARSFVPTYTRQPSPPPRRSNPDLASPRSSGMFRAEAGPSPFPPQPRPHSPMRPPPYDRRPSAPPPPAAHQFRPNIVPLAPPRRPSFPGVPRRSPSIPAPSRRRRASADFSDRSDVGSTSLSDTEEDSIWSDAEGASYTTGNSSAPSASRRSGTGRHKGKDYMRGNSYGARTVRSEGTRHDGRSTSRPGDTRRATLSGREPNMPATRSEVIGGAGPRRPSLRTTTSGGWNGRMGTGDLIDEVRREVQAGEHGGDVRELVRDAYLAGRESAASWRR